MKKLFLYISISSLLAVSCNDEQQEEKPRRPLDDYSWNDTSVISFTDINNPLMGFTQEDAGSLNQIFANFIFEAIERDDVAFFDAEFSPIPSKKAKELLQESRTILYPDPEDPDQNKTEIRDITLAPSDIVQVMVKENWFFSEEDFIVQKRVTHIAPVVYSYDHEGDVRGKKLLFWVRMN